jgi:hypothetical protein
VSVFELRDLEEARLFLLQGLWWQRVMPPAPALVRPALEWMLEIASAGQPLPAPGFVADLGHAAFGHDWEARSSRQHAAIPALPSNLVRTYEDHVLGKVYADWTFARAADALRRYQGRDRARGLAFLFNQFRERAGFGGVTLSPGVIKAALEAAPEEVLGQGWESLRLDGARPLLAGLYESLVTAVRRTAEILGPEDLFELEHGTALKELGERLALRQVLHAATTLEAALPRHRSRPPVRRQEVPTRILDEDTYPVGGFSSLSTRGSVESLLHSQLAFMEKEERPDLFDVKFLRDELLYYSRDENQFLRRRRTFVFALYPDLTATRFKDAELPYQRGVLLLALLIVAVRRLSEWLSTDALAFEFLFIGEGEEEPLAAERALVETLLEEPIKVGTVRVERLPPATVAARCEEWARRSLCHCLAIGVAPPRWEADETVVGRLCVAGSRPALGDERAEPALIEGDDALTSWSAALEQVLQRWV